MKNITLSIDESVLTEVRRYAAEHNTTVNAMVREHLTRIAEHTDRAARARQKLRTLSEQSEARLESASWTRDQLHER